MTATMDPRTLVPEFLARDGWSRDELLAHQQERLGLTVSVTGSAADLVAVEADVDRDVPGLDAHGRSIRRTPCPAHRGDPQT